MFTNIRKIIFRSLGIIIFIFIFIFSYYQYRSYVNGPEIIKINMEKYMEVTKSSLIINAEIKNTKSLNINGKNVALIDKKRINEIVVFSPGNNIIKMELEDTFEKKISYIYNVYYVTDYIDYIPLQELKNQQQESKENLEKEN